MQPPEDLNAFDFILDAKASAKTGIGVKVIRQWASAGYLDHIRLPGSESIMVRGASLVGFLSDYIVKASASPATPAGHADPECAVSEFVGECATPEKGSRVAFRDLYRAYTTWTASQGVAALGKRTFGMASNALGYNTLKLGSVAYKTNIRLKTDQEDGAIAPDADRNAV